MAGTNSYRWNTSGAAEAFDRAAEFIHPHYTAIQDRILDRLAPARHGPFLLVDLGGGSGRLAERVLMRFPNSKAVIVDQSEPFLALAERRLQRFGPRAELIDKRLQDDWPGRLPAAPQAIVSMSAIHHLDPAEKRGLYARCHQALAPGGVFINGDEFRPVGDSDYLAMLREWSTHMHAAMDAGRIPATFRETLDYWHDRNIRHFGEPKASGDDFHETIAAHLEYLRSAGFTRIETAWADKLWAVLLAYAAGK